jgi:hypothetical protein
MQELRIPLAYLSSLFQSAQIVPWLGFKPLNQEPRGPRRYALGFLTLNLSLQPRVENFKNQP